MSGAPAAAVASWNTFCNFRKHLIENQEQILDILQKWDDGDGCTTAKEFRQGWRVLESNLGLTPVPRELIDELYEEIDIDDTTNIPFDDISIALRNLPVPEESAIQEEEEDDDEEEDDEPSAASTSSGSTQKPPSKRSRAALPQLAVSPRPSHASIDVQQSPSARSTGASPSPRQSARGFGGGQFEPPRKTNLPRLGGLGAGGSHAPSEYGGGGGASPRGRHMSSAASHVGSHYTSMTCASGCSTSTAAHLSPQERHFRRAAREKELADQYARHNLPGFNVPGPGQYVNPEMATTFAILKPHKPHQDAPAPWSHDEMSQHNTLDPTGRPIDFHKPKTHVGDPGWYASRRHEMYQPRAANFAGVQFNSPLPQRPVAANKRGEPAVLPWQVWNGTPR